MPVSITSTPPNTSTRGGTYNYTPVVEGGVEPYSWVLMLSPDGAIIHPSTGQVFWEPLVTDDDIESFSIRLTDDEGTIIDQSWHVALDGSICSKVFINHHVIFDDTE